MDHLAALLDTGITINGAAISIYIRGIISDIGNVFLPVMFAL